MVLRQVLELHQSSGKSASSVGSVKLKHSSCSVIHAHGIFHSRIFLHTAFSKLLTKRQDFYQVFRCILNHLGYYLFTKTASFKSVVRKPAFHLLYGVRIFKTGKFLHLLCKCRLDLLIKGNGILNKNHINTNSTVIDFLI